MEVHLRGAADDGGGEDGGCQSHQENQDHKERFGKEAVGKIGVEYEQDEGECRRCNGGNHRGDCEAPTNAY